MALIRIEPRKDPSSDLYYLEIFHPAESAQPFVTTEPRRPDVRSDQQHDSSLRFRSLNHVLGSAINPQ
jgi:hypothetical protein